jgi:hypothetical protein
MWSLSLLGSSSTALTSIHYRVSDELYQKPTHFLLELIQNADDNTYETASPTVRIHYRNRRLLVSCNEVGFTRWNVDALCRIGKSTKAGKDQLARYTGEKGIGFKSVFKVADVVWVQSGFYSFKFDRRQKLGMITPIWSTFPDKNLKGFTSILLQLSADYDEADLLRELKTFEPRLLIFLNRLKEINISISQENGRVWQTNLSRSDYPGYLGEYQQVNLRQDAMDMEYTVTKFIVGDLPSNAKRPGSSTTTIWLAFPTTQTGQRDVPSQSVYAFLPIRDYGFKFLIQADFLLIASREDIDSSSAWNQHLLRSIPSAILDAIRVLDKTELRYTWPQFFQPRPVLVDFFSDLERQTLDLLSRSPILRSINGDLAAPRDLVWVNLGYQYVDRDGKPLTLSKETSSRYLSLRYSERDAYFLDSLGVQKMSFKTFLADLHECLSEPGFIRTRSQAWHSDVATALLILLSRDPTYREQVRKLQLIPLMDDQWVTAKSSGLLLHGGDDHPRVPLGIGINEVRHDSSKGQREQLLLTLGVKPYDMSIVCRAIVEAHSKASPFSKVLAQSESVIQQALFIFEADWADPLERKLWLVGEDGAYKRGDSLYCLESVSTVDRKILLELGDRITFVHSGYHQRVSSGSHDRWIRWLQRTQKVNFLPRLVAEENEGFFEISPEFRYLLRSWDSIKILGLLKTHWNHYRVWLEERYSHGRRNMWESSRKILVGILGSVQVDCHGGFRAKLKDTVLPLKIKVEDIPLDLKVPFLDVPSGQDWEFLEHLGVGSRGLSDILFKHLKSIRNTQQSVEVMEGLYKQLHACRNEGQLTGQLR